MNLIYISVTGHRTREKKRIHIELMKKICIDFLHPKVNDGINFDKFKYSIRMYLDSRRQQDLDDIVKYCDALEAAGHIYVGHYDVLKELTRDIDIQIIEIIERAEKEIQKVDEFCDIHDDIVEPQVQGEESSAGLGQNHCKSLITILKLNNTNQQLTFAVP